MLFYMLKISERLHQIIASIPDELKIANCL